MSGAALDELIEGWLNDPAKRLSLRFPDRLEQRFELDTGAERRRTLMVLGAFGFLLCALLYPVLCDSLPDVTRQSRVLYLDLSMPVGFAVAASMRLNLRPLLREGLALLANVIFACVVMYLFSITRVAYAPVVVAGVTALMVYNAVGIQLRFGYALAAMLVIIVAYVLALFSQPSISAVELRSLVIIAVAIGAYLMLANWRLERAARRAYLLMLRERLQRQDLSLRNLELDELARRDPLTGLANRRAYDSWMAAVWAQAAVADGGDASLGLIVIDVDRFKAYNDFYGHASGDDCLKKIAVCLRDQLRGTSDLAARLGGEEFAVLLPGQSEEVCADIAERVRLAVQHLELPHPGLGPQGMVSVSAGVASYAVLPGSSPASLFEAADSALYQAKISGRNRVCVGTFTVLASVPETVDR